MPPRRDSRTTPILGHVRHFPLAEKAFSGRCGGDWPTVGIEVVFTLPRERGLTHVAAIRVLRGRAYGGFVRGVAACPLTWAGGDDSLM